MAYRIADQAPR